jgi:hypothetical protein
MAFQNIVRKAKLPSSLSSLYVAVAKKPHIEMETG